MKKIKSSPVDNCLTYILEWIILALFITNKKPLLVREVPNA